MNHYIVCTEKIWNTSNYEKYFGDKENFTLFSGDDHDLLDNRINALKPRIIFFPHWSWKIPKEIYSKYECVIFHAADLPKGKGKEPFQWMIESGFESTVLTVFRCTEGIDAGPVYAKIPFSLNGSVEECYKRCSDITFDKIKEMTDFVDKGGVFTPRVQIGESTNCGNPTNEILLDAIENLEELSRKIRAWDAESYPKAYFEVDEFSLEFSNAIMRHDCIEAHVKIKMKEE